MSQKNKLDFSDFFSSSPEIWKRKILEELRSDSESALSATTGNLTVKGFYTPEDVKGLSHLRHLHRRFAVKTPRHWYTSEPVSCNDLTTAAKVVREALEGGADCFSFYIGKEMNGDLSQALHPVPSGFAPVLFYLSSPSAALLPAIASALKENLKGGIVLSVPEHSGEDVIILYQEALRVFDSYPSFRALGINAAGLQKKEAAPAREIALAVAFAIDLLDTFSEKGYAPHDLLGQFSFTLATGRNYLTEIAKFRAFRLVWDAVVSVTDPSFDAFATPLHAVTPEAGFVEDPYNNVLYNTTAAMAAVIGGCDTLCITPFNSNLSEPDSFSRRISRNISHILKEEAHLDYVADPAGGAYAIEQLTLQIAEQSLEMIKTIEHKGGLLKTLIIENQL